MARRSEHNSSFARRRGRFLPWQLLLVFLAFALSGGRLLAATFTASLDRDTITLGQSATLALTFGGGAPENPPSPPSIPNLQINYVGPSSQFSYINGRVSSTVTHNFTITPRAAGVYTIPAMTAEVGGQKLSSQPLKLTVLKPSAPTPEAIRSGSQIAFLKLNLAKKEVYLGEVFTAELELYLRDIVQNVGQFQFTGMPTDGFNVGKWVQGQSRREQIGNALYQVVPITVAFTAIKTGTFAFGPITASLVVVLPSGNRRSADPFDMPDPFGMFQPHVRRQLTVATEALNVKSLPLPAENMPADFNGAVGFYRMTATAGPTNVAVGDPVTVHVQITGRGALDRVSLPTPASTWHDFKIYPPTAKVETSDKLGLEGTKTIEQIVVPQNSDVKELPPISFSFFNPNDKTYHTVTQPPVALTVHPGGSTPTPTIAATPGNSQNTPPPQDIVAIKQHLGTVGQITPPLVQQRWFLALQGVPILALFSVVAWRKRSEALANNPRLRRQRQVTRLVQQGLARLRQDAARNDSDAFFATLTRVLQEQLGERLNMPASAITEAVIEEQLQPRGVSDELLAPLHDLFQTCNLARYAPIKTSQELAAIIPKLDAVLHQLRDLKA